MCSPTFTHFKTFSLSVVNPHKKTVRIYIFLHEPTIKNEKSCLKSSMFMHETYVGINMVQGSHRLDNIFFHDFSLTIFQFSMTIFLLNFRICGICRKHRKMQTFYTSQMLNFLGVAKKKQFSYNTGQKLVKFHDSLITKFHDFWQILHVPWLFHDHFHFPGFPVSVGTLMDNLGGK